MRFSCTCQILLVSDNTITKLPASLLTLVDVFLGAQAVAHLELPEGLCLGAAVLLKGAVRAARTHIADRLVNNGGKEKEWRKRDKSEVNQCTVNM